MRLKSSIRGQTFPSLVMANIVCSPPMTFTGESSEKASQSRGVLILFPSTPPSCPLWLWPQPYTEKAIPSGMTHSLGYLQENRFTDTSVITILISQPKHWGSRLYM